MALKVVSMEELRLQVLLEPGRTGESVAEVCLRRGISRASFYRYRQRFLEDGAEGLEPRSEKPRFSPGQDRGLARGRDLPCAAGIRAGTHAASGPIRRAR